MLCILFTSRNPAPVTGEPSTLPLTFTFPFQTENFSMYDKNSCSLKAASTSSSILSEGMVSLNLIGKLTPVLMLIHSSEKKKIDNYSPNTQKQITLQIKTQEKLYNKKKNTRKINLYQN